MRRALGLPTRVVNGVVYVPEYGGFLYHSWNEVWIEGEGARDLVPLAGMLGRARVTALGGVAHW